MRSLVEIWLTPRATLAKLAERPKLLPVLLLGAVWGLERNYPLLAAVFAWIALR